MGDKTAPSGQRLSVLGFIAVALGVIAIAAPAVAAGTVVIIVGLTMLAAGITQLVEGFRGDSWRHRTTPVILGLIGSVSGVLVLAHPLFGLGFLTLLFVVFFVLEGFWKMFASLKFRNYQGWIWMLLSGALSLLLGVLIWNQWPLSGVWAIGILVGIELLSTGISLVILGSAVKEFSKKAI